MEDAGLFSMLIITDEYRKKVFNMNQEELNIALECRRWLQEHTTAGGDTTGSLLPCADSADILLSSSTRASKALGQNEMMLASLDLSQYKGQYSKLAEILKPMEASETRASRAAQSMDEFTRISFRDVNLDAKVFTHLYPYGTGKLCGWKHVCQTTNARHHWEL